MMNFALKMMSLALTNVGDRPRARPRPAADVSDFPLVPLYLHSISFWFYSVLLHLPSILLHPPVHFIRYTIKFLGVADATQNALSGAVTGTKDEVMSGILERYLRSGERQAPHTPT